MKFKETLSWIMTKIQLELFPYLEEVFTDPITKKQKRLIEILEIVEIQSYILSPIYNWMGRKPKDRCAIGRAFVAKTVYNYPTTRDLIESLHTMPNLRKICGFAKKKDIPSESTFSRAFREFSESELGERVHNALIQDYLSEQLIGHISRDSTAIEGNEKPKKKEEVKKEPKKRGRPKKGQEVVKSQEKRIDRQAKQSSEAALKELPKHCDVNSKVNAKGYKQTWTGYKFHIDTADCALPITAVLTHHCMTLKSQYR